MEKNEKKTFVRFLIDRLPSKGVFAYFPYFIYYSNGYAKMKTCYATIGQHGGCTPEYAKSCRLAKPEEYKNLMEELESIGYNLKIAKPNL